jgi:hypothetical protein
MYGSQRRPVDAEPARMMCLLFPCPAPNNTNQVRWNWSIIPRSTLARNHEQKSLASDFTLNPRHHQKSEAPSSCSRLLIFRCFSTFPSSSSSIACVLSNRACPHPFDLSRLRTDHALNRCCPHLEVPLRRSHATPRWLTVPSTPPCRGGPSLRQTCRIIARPTNGGEEVQRNIDRSGIPRSTRRTCLRRERDNGMLVRTNTWAAAAAAAGRVGP